MSFERREADQIEGVAPPETQQLIGHQDHFFKLEAAMNAGRLPSAILVHGPRGIGKATFAFNIAQRVLETTSDESPERIRAQIENLSHPNVFVLRRATDPKDDTKYYSAIRVDDVRETRDALQRTRGRAGHRICIIDSVDDCNINSANALLKTLEEPPAETMFIVLTHKPGGLLATIRSRCQSFGLRPISDDSVRSVLQSAQPNLDSNALERAIQFSGGRPRRAFEMLMLSDGDVLDALITFLQNPSQQPIKAQLAIADALAQSKGAELGFALEVIRDWIADRALQTAKAQSVTRFHLASANALWEKANALIADSDVYNLDWRQTLVAIFDSIRDFEHKTS